MRLASMILCASALLASSEGFASNSEHCAITIAFKGQAQSRSQQAQLSPKVTLELKQWVDTHSVKGVKVASNVICQHLDGQAYTGSQQEWQAFIDRGIKGLLKAGFKDMQFTRVGSDAELYQGPHKSLEYIYRGTKDDNRQHIYNLAVLNKATNELVTLSVSGNEAANESVYQEFKRLVDSFSF
ncbi:hypothetical protein MHM95_09430 [Pseudoalteromonas sp. CnMc7-15]|uniref:hypothetical protein n=1 Tax=unclassified Pseudoalteromonas TaxID=194690 RepID=UPI001EF55E22|nr:hypothetical protein [Pseudoalteromonas sp. CnMc7-15]MCG7566511.1 hypothetical protein [Pseudoalteromonas sp. CnMc7-15]